MLLRDISKVWISKYEETNDHGEISKTWKYKGIAYLNMQQDVNELDKKSTGEVDYEIYKGRSDKKYDIAKGDGISFEDITKEEDFKPEYRVLDINNIGRTFLYRMEKLQ